MLHDTGSPRLMTYLKNGTYDRVRSSCSPPSPIILVMFLGPLATSQSQFYDRFPKNQDLILRFCPKSSHGEHQIHTCDHSSKEPRKIMSITRPTRLTTLTVISGLPHGRMSRMPRKDFFSRQGSQVPWGVRSPKGHG